MAGEGAPAALDAKQEGNDHFRAGRLESAVHAYSRALESQPDPDGAISVQCLNNRAMCLIKLERFQEARADLDRVLQCEPGNVKALYRRGCAARGLAQYAEAVRDALAVLQVDPRNASAQSLARDARRLAEQENSQLGKLVCAALDAGPEDGGIAPLRLAAYVSEREAAAELVRWRGGAALSELWAKRSHSGAASIAPLLAVAGSDLSPAAAGEALLPHIPCVELASAVETASDPALRRKLIVLATALANAPSLRDDAALCLCQAAASTLKGEASASDAATDAAQTQRAALQVAATVCQPVSGDPLYGQGGPSPSPVAARFVPVPPPCSAPNWLVAPSVRASCWRWWSLWRRRTATARAPPPWRTRPRGRWRPCCAR